ncbi:uncharacterized protein TEOVI_000241600 [Trypanosoma equiperdum]|uniref:Mpv17 / PMP22 family n=1 Tax=Trypanosoma equiperdum TaxID=5694 RepID=A0A1G4IEY2_TRYEQ|nr:hypothetical protein, conserved [Trypanosoma equiperdum]
MSTQLVREVIFSSVVWTAGDFLAQFLDVHIDAARRRAAGEPKSDHPSGKQMIIMVDQQRLGFAAVFGAIVAPGMIHFRGILARVVGSAHGNTLAAFSFLTAQQLFATPLMLLFYHNSATMVRGGFTDPSFLSAHETSVIARLRGRYDAMAVERRIAIDILPQTLLASWCVFLPQVLHSYMRGRSLRSRYAACLHIPWLAYVSYVQSTMLL